MTKPEYEKKMERELITKEDIQRYRDYLSVGKKCRVVHITNQDDYRTRKVTEQVVIAKKYPHFAVDTKGRCWQYPDLIVGAREEYERR